jgi:hypothetical protein
MVKYITPTISGFAASTSWGEDDTWDVALRYAGEFAGFRLGAGAAYAKVSDETSKCANVNQLGSSSSRDCESYGGSASIMHVATGLFLNGSWTRKTDNNLQAAWTNAGFGGTVGKSTEHWTVAAGIEQKWFALGKTTVFGSYAEADVPTVNSASAGALISLSSSDAINSIGGTATVKSGTYKAWGFGLVQSVDAAALDLYVGYINQSADVTLQNTSGTVGKSRPIDDWQAVMTGATIKF